MRPFEILLIVFCAVLLLPQLNKLNKTGRFTLIGIFTTLMMFHLVMEGWRWQLFLIYGLGLILVLLQAGTRSNLNYATLVPAGLLVLVSIVLSSGLPVPTHLQNTGEYRVGTSSLDISDVARQRVLPTKVWYPIDEPATLEPAPWVDHINKTGPALAQLAKLPDFTFSHLQLATAGFKSELDHAKITDKPILLLSHGRGAFKELNTFMALEFASQGYIVIAPDHTEGALLTVLQNGTEILFNPKQFGENEGLSVGDKHQRVRELGQRWSQDLSFVLKHIQEIKPELANKTVISGGHSTGGGAAIEFCIKTAKCLGTVGLDTWMEPLSENTLVSGSTKPLLSLFSDPYEQDFEPINHERFSKIDAAMKRASVFSKEVVIAKAGHMDFCDAALLSPYSYLLGQDKGRISSKRVMYIINQHSLAFANTLIKGGDFKNANWPNFKEEMSWVNVQ